VCIIQAISLYTTGVIYESLQKIPVDNKRMQTTNETFAANVTKEDDVILHLSLTDDSGDKQQKRNWNCIINNAKHIFNVFEAVFTFAFPPVLIVIMNACIIHGLAQYSQTFNTGAANNSKQRSRGNHQVNIEVRSHLLSLDNQNDYLMLFNYCIDEKYAFVDRGNNTHFTDECSINAIRYEPQKHHEK